MSLVNRLALCLLAIVFLVLFAVARWTLGPVEDEMEGDQE